MKKIFLTLLILFAFNISLPTPLMAATAPYPQSSIGIQFNTASIQTAANGSDNFPVTWGNDDFQYTSWGDGNGFTGGTTKHDIGVSRVTGYNSGTDLWSSDSHGKSYGILALGNVLYMWQCGEGSESGAYLYQQLLKSSDSGVHWSAVSGVKFTANFFCPTFLQKGKGYQDDSTGYVYSYAPINNNQTWDVQKPGKIILMRVPKGSIENAGAYEFYNGMSGDQPSWGAESQKQPVFTTDNTVGVMRTSVNYNFGLKRYFLITQHVSRQKSGGALIGIYDAPQPWGPWTTVLFANPWQDPYNIMRGAGKTVFWNFSNKWASTDGKNFVMVYTEADRWATVTGSFTTGPQPSTQPSPSASVNPSPSASLVPSPSASLKPSASPSPSPCPPGDVNCDGVVSASELKVILEGYLTPSPDLTGDAKVNSLDISLALKYFGTAVSPSTSLISNLSVKDGATANLWFPLTSLKAGDQQYSDRTYTFTQIPSTLIGAEWIQTANASRSFSQEPLATLTLTRSATVYIAHADIITPKPAWLSDYTLTTMDIINNESTPRTFSVYAKTFPANSLISLGPNGSTTSSMYSVVVRE